METIEQIKSVLTQELSWCKKSSIGGPNADYEAGFMAGIEQALFLVDKVEHSPLTEK